MCPADGNQASAVAHWRHMLHFTMARVMTLPCELTCSPVSSERRRITGRVFAERFRRPSTSPEIHIYNIYDTIAYSAQINFRV
jgi:hypothetical protein